MKISYMIKREDFYDINEKTLNTFFGSGENVTRMYIYPELNAITTKNPSKKVKDFIYTEFNINASFIKKTLVNLYSRLSLNSFGFIASKKCEVKKEISNDILIYPCNKKYRIFDFSKNTVDVLVKDGFLENDILHEIEFRTKKDLPDFVPSVISSTNNTYKEVIIDGKPLARISENHSSLCIKAYKLLRYYGKEFDKKAKVGEYLMELVDKINSYPKDKILSNDKFDAVIKSFSDMFSDEREVILTFSHGDLQSGNIWIENETEKIYIIDWESWGERSIWYDKAVLFDGLRPKGIDFYMEKDLTPDEKNIVILEDIIFRLNELYSLPDTFGADEFDEYIEKIYNNLKI